MIRSILMIVAFATSFSAVAQTRQFSGDWITDSSAAGWESPQEIYTYKKVDSEY